MVRLINEKQSSEQQKLVQHSLDLVGFIEFLLQIGYYLYRKVSQIPAEFMPILFERLRENNQTAPMFNKLFNLPDKTLERRKLRELNK